MSRAMDGQDLAYERAVLEARADGAMAEVISGSFLGEDIETAWNDFRGSEHWERIRETLDSEGIGAGARILDLGGGRGLVAASLAAEGFSAVLCEPNPSLVCGAGFAAEFSKTLEHPFEVSNCFVGELDRSKPFDAVVCRAVLHHIHPLAPVLEDCRHVLKPESLFLASDEPTIRKPEMLARVIEEHPFVRFGVDEWAGTRSRYREEFRKAGFVRVRDRFPVSFHGYRRCIRPDLDLPRALAGYAKYRLATRIRPPAPEPRTFLAWSSAPPRP